MKSFQWLQELKGTDTHQKQGYKKNKTEIPSLSIITTTHLYPFKNGGNNRTYCSQLSKKEIYWWDSIAKHIAQHTKFHYQFYTRMFFLKSGPCLTLHLRKQLPPQLTHSLRSPRPCEPTGRWSNSGASHAHSCLHYLDELPATPSSPVQNTAVQHNIAK